MLEVGALAAVVLLLLPSPATVDNGRLTFGRDDSPTGGN